MPSTLIFPDGVRLALRYEIPGPEQERAAIWARIEAANIAPGFTIMHSNDARFSHYAEINVDAPHIWAVFSDLCHALLGRNATLIAGEVDETPTSRGSAEVATLIAILEPHQYRLAHDGYLQFGLLDEDGMINEVVVVPTKHFQVWLNDERRFRLVMQQHGLGEDQHLQLLDEYPHMTVRLDSSRLSEPAEFMNYLAEQIDASSGVGGKTHH